MEGVCQVLDVNFYFVHQLAELLAVGKLYILVVEVEFEFEQGCEMQKLPLQFFELLTELAAHLAHCHLVCCLCRGRNQVGHSFCLTEVEFPVKKGTLCVFAWLCLMATELYESLHDGIHDEARAMARYFYGIFPRVAMWRAKKTQQNFVDDISFGIV